MACSTEKHVVASSSLKLVNKARKSAGRPRKWAGRLLYEFYALDIWTNLDNNQLLSSLQSATQDTMGGTRSIQGQRKLIGPQRERWRSRNATQTHRRIDHLKAQDKPGRGSGVFSLDDFVCQQSQSSENLRPLSAISPSVEMRSRPNSLGSPDPSNLDCLTFTLVSSTSKQAGEKPVCIVASKTDDTQIPHVKFASEYSELAQTLKRISQHLTLEGEANGQPNISVALSYIDLTKNPLLDSIRLSTVLAHCVTKLALNNCHLEVIPHLKQWFPHLCYLNLSRNKLRSIDWTGLPDSLKNLDLQYNKIAGLPPRPSTMSLQRLALTHNSIRSLPSWLSECESLEYITLDDNPLDTKSYAIYSSAYCKQREVSMEIKSCYDCIILATKALKHMLSAGSTNLLSQEERLQSYTCKVHQEAHTRSPSICVPVNGGHLTPDVVDPADYTENISYFKNYLHRMSMLPTSVRTSMSGMTLKSISSSGGRSRFSGMDLYALMLVHCCLREGQDPCLPCIHYRIAIWVNTGMIDELPTTVLQEIDLKGNSALHIAAMFGAHPKALRSLIANGCDPHVINNDSETFLHCVKPQVWNDKHQETVNLLTILNALGFHFNHRDHYGETIFHIVESLGRISEGTPWLREVMMACSWTRTATGRFFNHPAHVPMEQPPAFFESCSQHPSSHTGNVRLCLGSQPIEDVSLARGNASWIAGCSINCFINCYDPLHELAQFVSAGRKTFFVGVDQDERNITSTLECILNTGVNPNAYNESGVTVLMTFVEVYHLRRRQMYRRIKEGELSLEVMPWERQIGKCVELLLRYGADIHRRSRSGNTALHFAASYAWPFAVELFVRAGANVNACNHKGQSPTRQLVELMQRQKAGRKVFVFSQQCLAILTDHGAETEPTLEQQIQWKPEGVMPMPENFMDSRYVK